jgi:hypothetical protein
MELKKININLINLNFYLQNYNLGAEIGILNLISIK